MSVPQSSTSSVAAPAPGDAPKTVLFKAKGASKKIQPEARTTLDVLHTERVGKLLKEQQKVDAYKARLDELEAAMRAEGTTPVALWRLEREAADLRRKVAALEAEEETSDYFLRTSNILFEYYDEQTRAQKGYTEPKKSRRADGIFAYIESIAKREAGAAASATGGAAASGATTTKKGREELLREYLESEDPQLAMKITQTDEYRDPWTYCKMCGKEMSMCMNEATLTCAACGHQEYLLVDSDKPSYKDPPREVSYYAYKKINHLNEWIAQFQAKESTVIPQEIYDAILTQLKKEHFTDMTKLNVKKVREILRSIGQVKYYEHSQHIINKISGQAPFMSREDEERIRHMFREIQPAFKIYCPKDRKNFLSYPYILYKFCELLGLDEYLPYFPLLKNRDKLYAQDQTWKKICEEMRWQFIRTI